MSKISTDDPIQEKLAKTFFASSAKKDKNAEGAPRMPWIISAFALLLALLVFLSRSNIDIKIMITPRVHVAGQKNLFFIKDGKPNIFLVGDMYFFGDAYRFSRQKDDMFVLVNSKGEGWANFSIDLKEPMNMEQLDISYVARGQIGDENLVLVLVDADNKSYRMPKGPSSALTAGWQERAITLKPARGAINLSEISTIRFEFGSLTAGNYPGATIFLKDIGVKKP